MQPKRKRLAEIEIYNNGQPLLYTGRLLGCISEEEYQTVLKDKQLQSRMLTVETTTCLSISRIEDIEDLRLVMAVKKRGKEEVDEKTLFITEPIDFISNIIGVDDLTFIGKKGSYIIVTETEVEVGGNDSKK